ncbi:MAG TPA: hypothetical protein PK251_12890 [Candidatus Latescibacteria bacterium]|nr:hypothetical protein [Candidatus Latescibacterota bacterium]HPK75536.1 hypothetical protein [Candidatus Latescibacterota bacterium]
MADALRSGSLSLFPLDERCTLLTNMVWVPDEHGVPSLHRQKMWVSFPQPVTVDGLTARFGTPVGRVRVETAEDDAGRTWRVLAEEDLVESPHTVSWPAVRLTNIRVHVVEPRNPSFPLAYTFSSVVLRVSDAEAFALPAPPATVPSKPLEDHSPAAEEPFGGHSDVHLNERLGLCHDPPRTNRVLRTDSADEVAFESPVFRMAFSRRHARVTHLSWDTFGNGRHTGNLLSMAHTRGAFPVVMREGRRMSSESCGGVVEVEGRSVRYRGISPAAGITWSYAFSLREHGFSLEIGWDNAKTFATSELAALRIPFDLYRSVVNVLAMPNTAGPSGLVEFPLVINAPNYGVMRVTCRQKGAALARIIPLRTRGELWLDLIPGAHPLESGVFEMPEGKGSVTLDFELTKVYPFGNHDHSDQFTWWEMPPFYSFADRENILGTLTNSWLNGLAFRPDLGRFANNSVADSAAVCAPFYADIAAYNPMLADGLDPRQFIRFAAEQLLRDTAGAADYSNWRHYPGAAGAPIDCAWLYVASTGDWEWAERWREGLRFFADALLQLEHRGTGLVASDYSGIPEGPGYMSCSWCDSIRSGHLESYVNAHAYRSLLRAADLLERIERDDACDVRRMAARLRNSFLPTFYDADSRQIMQWVARDGRRFGFRSHFHLGAAIALGLVPEHLARALLKDYLDRLAASGFAHFEWGLPIFLDPVPAACHNGWMGKGVEPDGSDQIGVYMNGAIHAHQTYYLLQALYRVGMRREANDLFMRMTPLVRNGGLCGGLHSGMDWRHPVDGRPSGYEGLLAEQFHFLLAAITGYFGCELTIDGLVINGPDTERIRTLKPNFARMASVGTQAG